ncbi:hypothetical protein O3G_MSEX014160 [Manduca sexta]|uniref:Ionotropic glutamate receptor L-glutamate and glycine-binding domain-containing protein n=2 Tax=Manduca sexta TaxID=7130 RepID=A0A922D0T9_MANSE|nr:hypothetical protein O3G_MSEX014160 [Manduca sexta]
MFGLCLCAVLLVGVPSSEATSPILRGVAHNKELRWVLIDILHSLRPRDITCIAVISDSVYLNVFDGELFRIITNVPFVMIIVAEEEDLLSPNYITLKSLRQTKTDGCNVYIIFLASGLQVARLLKFGDRHRILDTHAKYIMLHDIRLYHKDLHYLWKRIVNVVFIKYHRKIIGNAKSRPWFDLLTVPFPNPIKSVLVPRRVDIWRNDKFHYNRSLFVDKTYNLYGQQLNAVYLDHVPSVVVTRDNETSKIGGVEVEIFKTLSELMHFEVNMYQPAHAELNKWGQKQANGSFSGLLGEMASGRADAALGNLQYTPYHLELMDLSIPYTTQCWTFLTPEALTDNSWKTLILPFKLNMWIAVLLVLLITGTIFYAMARYYMNLQDYRHDHDKRPFANALNQHPYRTECRLHIYFADAKPVGLYVFGEIINSILYTYGMLLVVSLPRLPTGWSIRLLTGWYWLYCILLVVSYRASMTAILANPAPRVTIDTLQELADSKVTCGGWGIETKKPEISDRFETINDPNDAANRVAQGVYAYYDNSNFLKYISVKRKSGLTMESDNATTNGSLVPPKPHEERDLHIMSDCVVNIPISIGFHKNSPFKPLADIYIRRIVEVGLVEKWLNDAMEPIRALEVNDEEIKALMNLKKLYGAFVALAIGYFLSGICFLLEIIHWNCMVKKDPMFDKYAIDVYYRNKNKK